MWASPPCQAFSSAGTRKGALDDRNGWPWTLDILDLMEKKGVRPTWVICENVPGLTFHKADCTRDEEGDPTECPGCYWERWIIPEFKKRYASVQTGVLDAADFGLPQRRRRVFLVAGPHPFDWPKGTHSFQALVYSKWIDGSYWEDHGIEKPKKGPRTSERKEMGVELMFRGPEEGILPWVTVRDALRFTCAVRTEGTGAVSRTVDAPSPTVSGKANTYTAPEEGVRRNEGDSVRGDAMRFYERNSGQRGLTEKSPDDPSPTVQGPGEGGYDRLHVEDFVLSNPFAYNEEHGGIPMRTVDEPGFSIISRGDRMFIGWKEAIRNGQIDVKGTQDANPDDPSPTIRAGGNVDASGKLGGGAPPYLTEEIDEEHPDDDPDVFDMFGDVEEPPELNPSIGTGYLEKAGTRPELIDEPSRAVAATDCKGAGPHPERRMRASDDLLLSTGRRRLTVDECATLQGFPDDYPFQGNSTSRYRQVENAVAPPVAEALGRAIIAASKG